LSCQEEVLRDKRPHVLVATPGRALDLADAGVLDLSGVLYLALDEADKMLSLGFLPQLQRLQVRAHPNDRVGCGRKRLGSALRWALQVCWLTAMHSLGCCWRCHCNGCSLGNPEAAATADLGMACCGTSPLRRHLHEVVVGMSAHQLWRTRPWATSAERRAAASTAAP
jgi:hypothetical protein